MLLDHLLNLDALVSRQKKEPVRTRSYPLVLARTENDRRGTALIGALAHERTFRNSPLLTQSLYLLVHLAKELLVMR